MYKPLGNQLPGTVQRKMQNAKSQSTTELEDRNSIFETRRLASFACFYAQFINIDE